MADSIFKVHEMVNKVGFEFDDATAKKVTQLAEKAGQLAADSMTQELSVVVSEIGDIFNQALAKMGKQQIDLTDMIKMPNSGTIGKLTSSFVSQIASNISDGIVAGINNGLAKTDDIVKQLDALQKRKIDLQKESGRLNKRYGKYNHLHDVAYGEIDFDDYKPLEVESDIDEQAQRVMDEFLNAEEALDKVTRGTKEYNAALIKALDAASNLYSMSKTMRQNKNLVKDQTLLEDFSPENLVDTTNDLFEKYRSDFHKYFKGFDVYYDKQLASISAEIEQIDAQIHAIQQSNVEIVDQQKAQSALKTLNEIEEVYKRIKKPARNNILKSIEYVPTGHGKTLNAISEQYKKSFDSNESWEVQYQWLIKFVREYEAYAAKVETTTSSKRRSEMSHTLESYADLYKSLKPMAENAENSLRNILNKADGTPLVGIDNTELEKGAEASQKMATETQKAAEAESQARIDAEAKVKADEASADAAARERQERDAILKAKEKELVGRLDKYDNPADIAEAQMMLAERKAAYDELQKENLLTDEITQKYHEVNNAIKEKFGLVKKVKEEAAKAKQEETSYTPGGVLGNSMFANMFGKATEEAEKKQEANEGSAQAVQEELNATAKTTAELEKQQKLLLYRRGSTDFNKPYPNWSNQDSMWNIVDSLQWGQGGYGDGLYAATRRFAHDLVPVSEDIALSEDKFFEFDASKYNMFIVNTAEQAQKLEEYLTKLQKFILASGDFRGFDNDIQGLTDETLFTEATSVFEALNMSQEEFSKWIMQMKQLVALGGLDEQGKFTTAPDSFLTSRNFASRFMQNMGYEGVLMDTGNEDWDGNYKGSMLFNPDEEQIRSSMVVFNTGVELLEHLKVSAQAAEQAVIKAEQAVKKGQSYSGTLYHGSKMPMDNVTYDPSKGQGRRNVGNGLYFTPELEQAAKHGKHILQQQVQLDNVFTFTEDFITDIDDLYQAMGKVKPDNANWETIKRDLHAAMQLPGKAQEFTKNMLSMGYQGMYTKGYGYADPNVEQLVVYDEAYQQNLTTQPYDEIVNGAKVAEQAVDNLNASIEKTKQLEQDTHLSGSGTGDASSAALKTAEEEAERLRQENTKLQGERDQAEGWYNDEVAEKIAAEQRAEDAEAEIEKLKQKLASQTSSGVSDDKTGANIATSQEVLNLQTLKETIEAVTTTVGLKTQAFKDEAVAVNTAVESEVAQLSELEQKIVAVKSTLEGLLNNIKIGQDDIGAGLSNIVVNVAHADTPQNDLSPIIDAVSRIQIQPTAVTDVGNVLATENTLSAIKTAVEAINSKAQKGIKVKMASDTPKDIKEQVVSENKSIVNRAENGLTTNLENAGATSGNIDLKLIERIKTALTSLLKYKTTLQEANQLSGDLEVGIDSLANELSQVSDKAGLATWSEHFKQFKNASSILQTLVKDYQTLGAMQAKADAETDPMKLEQYLDNIQILQDRIDIKSVDVNVGDDRFEEARQRAYNLARHELQQKEELIGANQVEAEVIRRLTKLYEQLGRARANGNMMDVTRIRRLIGVERSQLASVDYATDMKFKAAKDKGYSAEKTKAENVALKEQESVVKNLINLYQKYGDLQERLDNADEGMAAWYTDESKKVRDQILAETQKLKIVTDAMQNSFDAAYATGKEGAASDILKKLYGEDDKAKGQADKTRIADINKLSKTYEQLGRAQAEFAQTGNLKTEHEINSLQQLINAEKIRLGLTSEQISALESRRNLAEAEKKEALEAAQREKTRAHYAKEEENARKKKLQQEKKLAQKEAMTGRAGATLRKAEATWMSGIGIQGALPPEFETQLDEYYEKLSQLRVAQAEILNSDGVISDEQKAELISQTAQVDSLTTEIGELISEYQRLSGDNTSVIGLSMLTDSAGLEEYKRQLTDVVMATTNGKAQIKNFDAETKTLTYTVKTGKNQFTEYTAAVRHLDKQLVSTQKTTKRSETFFEATARKMKEISSYLSGMTLLHRVGQELRRGIQYVRDIDSALTELKKVTDETEESYDKFLDTAAKTADKVGSTIQKVVSSTADWARLGYSMEEAAKFAETTQILMNVSEFTDVSQATDTLISAVQAFGYTADTSMDVVDLLNTIGKIIAYR